jgi:hypothetical protein
MLPFGVTILVTVPQRSDIPEGLMNNPVYTRRSYIASLWTDLFTMKRLFRSYKNWTDSRLVVHAYSFTNMADCITSCSLLRIWEKMQHRWEDTNTARQALSAKGWRLYYHPVLLCYWSVLFNEAVNCQDSVASAKDQWMSVEHWWNVIDKGRWSTRI